MCEGRKDMVQATAADAGAAGDHHVATNGFGHALVHAFKAVIDREIAGANEVREEIRRRGTYWAGDEIWKLRRQVASLRRRLEEDRTGDEGLDR